MRSGRGAGAGGGQARVLEDGPAGDGQGFPMWVGIGRVGIKLGNAVRRAQDLFTSICAYTRRRLSAQARVGFLAYKCSRTYAHKQESGDAPTLVGV